MEPTLPAIIGGAVGLVLGYVDFRVVAGVIEGKLRRLDTSSTPAEKDSFERKIRLMRVIFATLTIGAFPVVGYLLGQAVGGRP